MKRVLIVTPGFYPAKTYGGPVVSIKNLTDALGGEIDFYILTSNHELKQSDAIAGLPEGFSQRGKAKICYIPDKNMNEAYFKRVIDEVNPDCIYINAIFHKLLSPPMIKLSKKRNIRCVIAPRGGLCENAMRFSKYKKLFYIQYLKAIMGKNICFQSTSDEESSAIKYFFGTEIEMKQLTNLPKEIDLDANTYRVSKQKGEIRVIFFSRIHPKKNLKYALEVISNVTCNCQFDIYGPIEKEEYWIECENVISRMPENVKVNYCGYLENDDLQSVMGKYDLFFFPTLSENFGHVIAEAISEKCNVLLSDNTPWNDVNDQMFGRAFSLSQKEMFVNYIEQIALLSEDDIQQQRSHILTYWNEHFNFEELKKRYISLFE